VAAFDVGGERPKLHASTALSEGAIAWTLGAWRSGLQRLLRGDVVQSDGRCLAPIAQAGTMVGVLYVEAPRINREAVLQAQELLAATIVGARAEHVSRPWDTYLEATPPEEIERQKIMLLLQRFEWNLSRVAQEMGVSRPTIYRRLEELGIERKPWTGGFTRRRP
jgi:hypothetical protein